MHRGSHQTRLHLHLYENGDLLPHLRRLDDRYVRDDGALFLHTLDPLLNGRGRKADGLGNCALRGIVALLQEVEDRDVEAVQFNHVCGDL